MNSTTNVVLAGFLGSLVASFGTAVGAMGVFAFRTLSRKLEDGLLSAAAGVMLAAACFSLLPPAIEYAGAQYGGREAGVLVVIAGMMTGAWVLYFIHQHVPHEHFIMGREGPDASGVARIWLFVIAITLHNFPEGMAVGVGFAGGDIGNGIIVATGIGIQNMPEGLAVAVSLISIGYSRVRAFATGTLTGLAEPLGGLFGSVAVSLAAPLTPLAMGFAAGAMIFIISDEIIPETHRTGYSSVATFSLLAGFAAMIFLDATLS